jgi:hypothetical protein
VGRPVLVSGDLDWSGTEPDRASKEGPRCSAVAAFREQNVDDLAVLVDSPIEIRPPPGDLDVGLVQEPPIAGCVAESRSAGDRGALELVEVGPAGEQIDDALDRPYRCRRVGAWLGTVHQPDEDSLIFGDECGHAPDGV